MHTMPLTKEKTVAVPIRILNQIAERTASLAELYDELENKYLAGNKSLLRALRVSRRQHLRGETISYGALKKKLGYV